MPGRSASAPLALVPLLPGHAPLLAGWFPDRAAIVQWAGPAIGFPLDEAALAAMLDGAGATPPDRLGRLALGADGAAAGTFQVRIDRDAATATLTAVAIAPPLRGTGLGRPLVAAAIRTAAALPGIERLSLRVFAFNAPAIRLYLGLGFAFDPAARETLEVGGARWELLTMRRGCLPA